MGATVIRGNGSGSTSIGVGSLSVVTAAQPASVNLSTEGTIDWLALNGNATNPPRYLSTADGRMHSKIFGGDLLMSFDWVFAGVGASSSNNAEGVTLQTNAADDVCTAALNSTSKSRIDFSGTVGTGWGFRYRFPVDTTNRVNRIYINHWSCDALVRVSLSDGSAADATLALTNGSGVNATRMVTINALAGSACICTVSVLTTTTYSGPSMTFGGASIGSV